MKDRKFDKGQTSFLVHVLVSFLSAIGRSSSLGRLRYCFYISEVSKIPASHSLNKFTRLVNVISCSGTRLDS